MRLCKSICQLHQLMMTTPGSLVSVSTRNKPTFRCTYASVISHSAEQIEALVRMPC